MIGSSALAVGIVQVYRIFSSICSIVGNLFFWFFFRFWGSFVLSCTQGRFAATKLIVTFTDGPFMKVWALIGQYMRISYRIPKLIWTKVNISSEVQTCMLPFNYIHCN